MPDPNVLLLDLNEVVSPQATLALPSVIVESEEGARISLGQIADFTLSDTVLSKAPSDVDSQTFIPSVDSDTGNISTVDLQSLADYTFSDLIQNFVTLNSVTLSGSESIGLDRGSSAAKVSIDELSEYGFEQYLPSQSRLTSSNLASGDCLPVYNVSNSSIQKTLISDIANYVYNGVDTLGEVSPNSNTTFLSATNSSGVATPIDDVAEYVLTDYLISRPRMLTTNYADNDKVIIHNTSTGNSHPSDLTDLKNYIFNKSNTLPNVSNPTRVYTVPINNSGASGSVTLSTLADYVLSGGVTDNAILSTLSLGNIIPVVNGSTPTRTTLSAISDYIWDRGDNLPTVSLADTDYLMLSKGGTGRKATLASLENYVNVTNFRGNGFVSTLSTSDELKIRDVSNGNVGYTNLTSIKNFTFDSIDTLSNLTSVSANDYLVVNRGGSGNRTSIQTLAQEVGEHLSKTTISVLSNSVYTSTATTRTITIGDAIPIEPNTTYEFSGSMYASGGYTNGIQFGIDVDGAGEQIWLDALYRNHENYFRHQYRQFSFYLVRRQITDGSSGIFFRGVLKTSSSNSGVARLTVGKVQVGSSLLQIQSGSNWKLTKSA